MAVTAAGGSDTAAAVRREGAMQRLNLPLERAVSNSYAAESAVRLEPIVAGGPTALHWSVVVDHFAGEPAYPVGWPRFGVRLPDEWRDWSAWERLFLRWRVESSRERLPADAIGFQVHAPDKSSSHLEWLRPPSGAGWDDWRLDLERLTDTSRVTQMQWHISESAYRHGDRLDVWIAEIALERFAAPTVVEVRPECAHAWADTRAIGVIVRLGGVQPGATVTAICEVARGGRALASRRAPLGRGLHRLSVPAPAGGLGEGAAEVIARIADGPTAATARVVFVASPWEERW